MSKNIFSFKGRIARSTYWLYGTGIFLISLSTKLFILSKNDFFIIIGIIFYVPLLWASIALQVKRWHDINCSGFFVLINFIPLAGVIVSMIANGFIKGKKGKNQYGDDPLCSNKYQPESNENKKTSRNLNEQLEKLNELIDYAETLGKYNNDQVIDKLENDLNLSIKNKKCAYQHSFLIPNTDFLIGFNFIGHESFKDFKKRNIGQIVLTGVNELAGLSFTLNFPSESNPNRIQYIIHESTSGNIYEQNFIKQFIQHPNWQLDNDMNEMMLSVVNYSGIWLKRRSQFSKEEQLTSDIKSSLNNKEQKILIHEFKLVQAIPDLLEGMFKDSYIKYAKELNNEFRMLLNQAKRGQVTLEEISMLRDYMLLKNVQTRRTQTFWVFSGITKEEMTKNRFRFIFLTALKDHMDGDFEGTLALQFWLNPEIFS